jgi:8-oxo-dGTP pyrophosphatase MutT (NUDIX family)
MKLKIETSAGGIVCREVNNKSHWLIVKHSQYKKWTFPKGLIGDKTENENVKAAAIREVEEEGGVQARIIDNEAVTVQYNYRFKDFFIKKTVYYYLMEYISGDVKDHDFEVSDASFEDENRVKEFLGFKSDKEAFIKILLKQKQLF